MKTLPTLTGSLALSALLLTAYAQAPATSHDNPTPAKPTAKAAPGAKDSKTIGQKMVWKSKPTDTVLPHKVIKK
jgi:hypothetical protein